MIRRALSILCALPLSSHPPAFTPPPPDLDSARELGFEVKLEKWKEGSKRKRLLYAECSCPRGWREYSWHHLFQLCWFSQYLIFPLCFSFLGLCLLKKTLWLPLQPEQDPPSSLPCCARIYANYSTRDCDIFSSRLFPNLAADNDSVLKERVITSWAFLYGSAWKADWCN